MKYLCLKCLCETRTKQDGTCFVCGTTKPGRDTLEQLRAILTKRVKLPPKSYRKLHERYDLGQAQADEYANKLRTADDIPNEKGNL